MPMEYEYRFMGSEDLVAEVVRIEAANEQQAREKAVNLLIRNPACLAVEVWHQGRRIFRQAR
jgi:hypothetical protein